MPVLNVFARDDHIIPPATSRALAAKIGSKDYSEVGRVQAHQHLLRPTRHGAVRRRKLNITMSK